MKGVVTIFHDIVGVLLAGGKSRRFGKPKAFASFEEQDFWKYSIDAMSENTDQQIIISQPDLVSRFKGKTSCEILEDDESVMGKGPLAGIYTAIKHKRAKWYVIISCDVPLIKRQTIHSLLNLRNDQVQAIIPQIKGKLHPLIGIYHYTVLDKIEQQLRDGDYRVIKLLEKITVCYVSEHDLNTEVKSFCNINSQEDYKELLTNGKISESKDNSKQHNENM